MAEHVAIVTRAIADALGRGTKTVETRFSRQRRPPFGCVRPGDTVHFKVVGGGIVSSFDVRAVRELADLTPAVVERLRRELGRLVAAPSDYWTSRRTARFGVLIWLIPLRSSRRPRRVPRQYGNAWITLPIKKR